MDIKEIVRTLKTSRALFVEDNKDSLLEMGKILKKIFINVDFATNGLEGLELFKKNNYDLIITDINMPKMNGLEMLKEIKKIKKDVYSILITAFNDSEYYLEAIRIGVDGFILKPIDLEQILGVFAKIAKSFYLKKEAEKYYSLLVQYQEIVDKNAIVCKVDDKGYITYVNELFEKLLKYKKDEILNKHYFVLLKDFSEEFRQEIVDVLKVQKEIWKGIVKFRDKNNNTIFLQASIKGIYEDNKIVEYIFIGYDISEIMKSRKFLLDYINRHENPVLSLIQIENFENIRKMFDENFIEEIEKKFQNLLENILPEEIEEVYILDNGIYAAVFDDKNNIFDDFIKKMKETLNKINHSMLEINGLKYDVYAQMSIAKGKDLFENARVGLEKLYELKQNFIVSNDLIKKVKEKARNNLKVLHILKEAISNNNIVCAFQPIIDNKTQKVVKYEALVRIKKGNTLIPPGEFLDIAKEGSFYTQITEIVLSHAFKRLQYFNDLSINISEIDIQKESIRFFIFDLLEKFKSVTHKITFELLEDENIEQIKELEEFIDTLKSFGVKIAIDDFGSGYSNFYRLKKYRPDFLKIDGSLIKDIVNDSFGESIVKAIVEFSKENNIKTIAEYVENEKIFKKVKELGIDYSQGYYFGKPVLFK